MVKDLSETLVVKLGTAAILAKPVNRGYITKVLEFEITQGGVEYLVSVVGALEYAFDDLLVDEIEYDSVTTTISVEYFIDKEPVEPLFSKQITDEEERNFLSQVIANVSEKVKFSPEEAAAHVTAVLYMFEKIADYAENNSAS